ncbi:hypothetical protein HAX54_022985 [Datura stramonium]|uniref:Uncharacterized protein n=1 Tax=Datura stramonium TaxID=4076 RepID=A0ABS8UVH8_DATST|nr:hypothetical protein [Datura stramonium]
MLLQGLIEQAKLDSFNYPFYAPYKDEVEKIVQMEGSFDVDTLEFFQVNWDERDNDDFDAYNSGKHVARTMRAVVEQMLVSHFQFGESTVDYLFERYAYHLASHLLVQKIFQYFHIFEKEMTKRQQGAAFANSVKRLC